MRVHCLPNLECILKIDGTHEADMCNWHLANSWWEDMAKYVVCIGFETFQDWHMHTFGKRYMCIDVRRFHASIGLQVNACVYQNLNGYLYSATSARSVYYLCRWWSVDQNTIMILLGTSTNSDATNNASVTRPFTKTMLLSCYGSCKEDNSRCGGWCLFVPQPPISTIRQYCHSLFFYIYATQHGCHLKEWLFDAECPLHGSTDEKLAVQEWTHMFVERGHNWFSEHDVSSFEKYISERCKSWVQTK